MESAKKVWATSSQFYPVKLILQTLWTPTSPRFNKILPDDIDDLVCVGFIGEVSEGDPDRSGRSPVDHVDVVAADVTGGVVRRNVVVGQPLENLKALFDFFATSPIRALARTFSLTPMLRPAIELASAQLHLFSGALTHDALSTELPQLSLSSALWGAISARW